MQQCRQTGWRSQPGCRLSLIPNRAMKISKKIATGENEKIEEKNQKIGMETSVKKFTCDKGRSKFPIPDTRN